MNNKKTLILSILGIIGLVIITVGVTYAIFNYVKEGTTENSITTGTITFIYEEIDKQGAGISISDAYPMSDEVGKAQTGSGNVFNFKVKSQTTNSAAIPYTVTARMKADSTLDQSAVRVYLTEVEGENETQVLLDNYNNLPQTSISVPDGTIEKEIYIDTVPKNSSNYEKNFRLRMWINEDTDFSSGDMNDKTFTITVNVYANAKVVTGNEDTTNTLDSLSISDCTLDPEFDSATTEYTCEVKNISSVEVTATATSEKATVAGVGTKEVVIGDNTIKVTVTAESGDKKTYIVIVTKKESVPLTAEDNLSIGDAVVGIDGSKWHVLEASASGTETVVLLSDYNLNSDGSYNTECGKDINSNTFCSQMKFNENVSDTTMNKYSESDSNNIGYFIKNTYKPLVTASLPDTTIVTIPTAAQLAKADGQSFSSTLTTLSIAASWLKTTSYWTKTAFASETTYVWSMKGNESKMYRGLVYSTSYFGVRPVITTLKSNLVAE